jgi:hypothetical protein
MLAASSRQVSASIGPRLATSPGLRVIPSQVDIGIVRLIVPVSCGQPAPAAPARAAAEGVPLTGGQAVLVAGAGAVVVAGPVLAGLVPAGLVPAGPGSAGLASAGGELLAAAFAGAAFNGAAAV